MAYVSILLVMLLDVLFPRCAGEAAKREASEAIVLGAVLLASSLLGMNCCRVSSCGGTNRIARLEVHKWTRLTMAPASPEASAFPRDKHDDFVDSWTRGPKF